MQYFILTFLLVASRSVFGQASFSTKTDFTTGQGPISIADGDFNGDGKLDIVVANYKSNTVSIFLNTTVPDSAVPPFHQKQI